MVLATGSSAVNQTVCNRLRSGLRGRVCVHICTCPPVCVCVMHAGAQGDGFPAFYRPFDNDGAGWN